jgi:hypothetical protein
VRSAGESCGIINWMGTKMDKAVHWGPCCFCGSEITPDATNPCRVTVETSRGKLQWWFCHGSCFKQRLFDSPELMGLFDPAHF